MMKIGLIRMPFNSNITTLAWRQCKKHFATLVDQSDINQLIAKRIPSLKNNLMLSWHVTQSITNKTSTCSVSNVKSMVIMQMCAPPRSSTRGIRKKVVVAVVEISLILGARVGWHSYWRPWLPMVTIQIMASSSNSSKRVTGLQMDNSKMKISQTIWKI